MSPEQTASPEQTEIVAAFESGQATGGGAPLKRIDTHMSHVFLDKARVYKLKKGLHHPFTDMSSLEQRRRACEAELSVNRKLAPGVYEAVSAVTRDENGKIALDGAGRTADWVVVMQRFPDGALLSEIAAAGRLTAEQVGELAHVIAGFHASLEPRRETGHAADYHRIIQGLRRTEAEGAAAQDVEPASDALFAALEHELSRRSSLIEARRKAGWVRHGHGDLHLNNICLFQGRVTPFDALEFDPALATADVLYDLAFLLMDLCARGWPRLANLAMNRYWDEVPQPEQALALLPLFMGLRAAVRMAVAVEAKDLAEAARYRRLGTDLLHRAGPRLLAVGGLSGTGKSTVAQLVAADLPGPCGARLLRTDAIRKAMAGVGETDRLSLEAYRRGAREDIYRALADRARDALDAGSSVVADATFQGADMRQVIVEAAVGRAFVGIWLQAPPEVRVARIEARRNDASDATAAVALAQTEPDDLGDGWRRVAADRPVGVIVDDLRSALV